MLDHDFGVSDILPPYRVRPEMHRRGLEYRLHVIESAPEVDEAVPFVVSELLFNLRSALDQLSYQLHVRHYRGRVPDDAERQAAFPILSAPEIRPRGRRPDDPAKWNEIKRLGQRERTAIKQFQPYTTRNDDLKATRETLNVLAALNNIDKHRRLHIIRTLPFPVSKAEDFAPECGFHQTIFYRPLVAGTEIERWTFEKHPTEMKWDQYCWGVVVLEERTLNLRVHLATFVREAFGYVCDVIGRFNTLFGYEPWRTWDALKGHPA